MAPPGNSGKGKGREGMGPCQGGEGRESPKATCGGGDVTPEEEAMLHAEKTASRKRGGE